MKMRVRRRLAAKDNVRDPFYGWPLGARIRAERVLAPYRGQPGFRLLEHRMVTYGQVVNIKKAE